MLFDNQIQPDRPLNKRLARNENQGPDGDCLTNKVGSKKTTKQYDNAVDEFHTLTLVNQNQTSKSCKEPSNINLENQSEILKKLERKPGNVNQKKSDRVKPTLPKYTKLDLSKVTSKVNCWSDKKQSTTTTETTTAPVTTTPSKVSVRKNVKNNSTKRPPFK